MESIFRVVCGLLLLGWLGGTPAAAYNIFPFESIGPAADMANGIEFSWQNPSGGQLFLTTEEGFYYYSIASAQWVDRTRPGWIGVAKYAVVPVPGHTDRLAMGGVNAWFKGTLTLSEDMGATEDLVYECTGGRVSDMALATQPDTVIFACTWSDIADGELLRSDNGGESYEPVFGHGHHFMTGVDAISSTEIYVSGDNYLQRTLDGGWTWDSLQGNLPAGQPLWCLLASPYVTALPLAEAAGGAKADPWVEAAILMVSNETGVYLTPGGAIDWQLVLPIDCVGLAYHFVQYDTFIYWEEFYAVTADGRLLVCLDRDWDNWVDATDMIAPGVPIDVEAEGGPVYVATRSNGVYVTAGIDALVPAPPPAPGLTLAARPNPFNPSTELLFSVPGDGPAVIEAYDLSGRKVATVFEGEVQAGPHTLIWQPRGLASGVYHAVLRQGVVRTTVRVTLVK